MDEKYNNLIIAIDGYSSSGKSTLAKDLAKVLNYKYIDSGAMYRAVTLIAIENGFVQEDRIDFSSLLNKINNLNFDFKFNPKKNRFEVYLNKICIEDKIRDLRIADKVSLIAKIKVIREKLVKLQRQFGSKGAIVMDGRDIGTVVFPNADLKIFMTANIKIRAQRRFFELKNESPDITIDNVIENIKKRDYIDENRAESPLKKAKDSIVLDNSSIDRDTQLQWAIKRVNEILNRE